MKLTTDQIQSMCERAFGNDIQTQAIQELGGGTFNTSYLITFVDGLKVILRVAPHESAEVLWDEAFLMRREHAMQPYFSPMATLMPRTLLVDFTHQLIDRDYMFQSFLEGQRWDHVFDNLTAEQNNLLYAQLGRIAQQIHAVQGEIFGIPLPGFQFTSWSEAVIDRFERALGSAHGKQIEMPHVTSILELIRTHPEQLDEIQTPRLLHGDLWLFNVLISNDGDAPTITAVLDADRAWWGDPMADWTMFILKHAENEAGHSHFWKAYGQPEETQGFRCRTTVYDAMHASTAYLWAVQHNDEETVTRATVTLSEVAAALPNLL